MGELAGMDHPFGELGLPTFGVLESSETFLPPPPFTPSHAHTQIFFFFFFFLRLNHSEIPRSANVPRRRADEMMMIYV